MDEREDLQFSFARARELGDSVVVHLPAYIGKTA
jgi:hypothetical protein